MKNSTIGVLLCKTKNDALVEMTLPKENANIFASRYQLYLPSKEGIGRRNCERHRKREEERRNPEKGCPTIFMSSGSKELRRQLERVVLAAACVTLKSDGVWMEAELKACLAEPQAEFLAELMKEPVVVG